MKSHSLANTLLSLQDKDIKLRLGILDMDINIETYVDGEKVVIGNLTQEKYNSEIKKHEINKIKNIRYYAKRDIFLAVAFLAGIIFLLIFPGSTLSIGGYCLISFISLVSLWGIYDAIKTLGKNKIQKDENETV